ncbi:MAG: hypothetical protein IPI77_19330 [Saprospiraceae bacterium]|nr:hypothetical protein [Saprospiraceae bacterium]
MQHKTKDRSNERYESSWTKVWFGRLTGSCKRPSTVVATIDSAQDFAQPVHMTSDRSFELVGDTSAKEVIDDITSYIAWEVSKKGKSIFY